jgi:arylsulfatase A-like enzyme
MPKAKSTPGRPQRPNVLLIMVDQYRFPRFSYGRRGMLDPIKYALGFQGSPEDAGRYARFFPGFMRLRRNAVVLRNHTIASAACIPSRATIMTGQYGTRTGVLQTDGLFKNGDARNFPWLEPEGVPTIGDWFRAAGYETHYFGKCHFANPPEHSLERFGFGDWELSYPEPHGGSPNNLGVYRDFGFQDLVTTFLRRKGLALDWDRRSAELALQHPGANPPTPDAPRPWLAVASFTNPHDIAAYPVLTSLVEAGVPTLGATLVPGQGAVSRPAQPGSWAVPLNPTGFPQNNATCPPGLEELLETKPDCQFDYSLKLGLALASAFGQESIVQKPDLTGLPFRLTSDPEKASRLFLQYYTYVHYVVDRHIDALLRALDETGLRDNTVVVFLSDHGEYGAAHGMMMEKWHTAYQEALHVPVVVSSPLVNATDELRQVDALTSHVDVLPTLLGLAGIDAAQRARLAQRLRVDHDVPELVGADLTPILKGRSRKVVEADGRAREGVLFMTDDTITEPLPYIADPHSASSEHNFEVFVNAVEWYRTQPHPGTGWEPLTSRLKPGPVCEPCHVRCVRDRRFKLVRYFDGSGAAQPVPDQWEMYDLEHDPNEMTNLLVYGAPFPTPADVRGSVLGPAAVTREAERLRALMARLEERMLSTGATSYPPPPKTSSTSASAGRGRGRRKAR